MLQGSEGECLNSLNIIRRTTKPPSTTTSTKKAAVKPRINDREPEADEEEQEEENEEEEEVKDEEEEDDDEREDLGGREDEEENEPETTETNHHHRIERRSEIDKENDIQTFDEVRSVEHRDDDRNVCRTQALSNISVNRQSTTVCSSFLYYTYGRTFTSSVTFFKCRR